MRDLFYRLENSFEHSTLKFEHVGDYYKVSLMYRSQVFVVWFWYKHTIFLCWLYVIFICHFEPNSVTVYLVQVLVQSHTHYNGLFQNQIFGRHDFLTFPSILPPYVCYIYCFSNRNALVFNIFTHKNIRNIEQYTRRVMMLLLL